MLEEADMAPPALRLIKAVRRIAIIVVDAQTEPDYRWDTKERSPGFFHLMLSLGRIPSSRYSFETLALFREVSARQVREIQSARLEANDPADISLYVVELHFSQLTNESDRRFFNSIPTRLQLPARTVDRLRHIAATELSRNEEFRRLVCDLQTSSLPTFVSVRNETLPP
jgi:hypothetical protein